MLGSDIKLRWDSLFYLFARNERFTVQKMHIFRLKKVCCNSSSGLLTFYSKKQKICWKNHTPPLSLTWCKLLSQRLPPSFSALMWAQEVLKSALTTLLSCQSADNYFIFEHILLNIPGFINNADGRQSRMSSPKRSYVSEPVGWYQNLQYSVSEPVGGCKDPIVQTSCGQFPSINIYIYSPA